MSGEDWWLAATLSLATGSAAFTVTETVLFAGFRGWVAKRNTLTGKLVGCGYCLSHWIAFVLVAVYRPRLFHGWWPVDYFLTALIISWLAAFQWAVLVWIMQRIGK